MTDLQMMESPDKCTDWPRWPFLPLKRMFDGDMQYGFLIDIGPLGEKPKVLPKIYLGSFYSLKEKTRNELKSIEYKTFTELVAAGWEID